jgi:RNA polymerase sigma-70 factor (ECF subfamily)
MKKTNLVQRTNEEWITALSDPVSDDALTDLGNILICGLRSTLSSRITTDLDSITEDFSQEALKKICKNIHTFRGESKFTTWAMKIAIHVAYTELRHWRRKDYIGFFIQAISRTYSRNQ